MRCSACGLEKVNKKGSHVVPRTWKRQADATYCRKCWEKRYVIRAVTIPVVRPLGEGVGWPEFRAALRDAWGMATGAANLAMSGTFAGDTHRNGQEKLPPKPRTYMYPAVTAAFPRLPTATASAITNTVEAKYKAHRYEIVWTGSASLPSARYPQPFPVPNQAWSPHYETAGKDSGDLVPCVSVRLPGGRFLLQLRGGREFARQLAAFRQLVNGEAIRGELMIMRKRADNTRNGVTDRDSGGQKASHRVMLKMVGWFPRREHGDRSSTLVVRTQADCFATAWLGDNKIRTWHFANAKRWIAEHYKRLQQWSDDQKAEQRPVASFQSRRESSVLKFKNRIRSLTQEFAAHIAGLAVRNRIAVVEFDDTCLDYFPPGRFNWSGLRTCLAQRLDQDGVEVVFASDSVANKTPEVLAESEGEE